MDMDGCREHGWIEAETNSNSLHLACRKGRGVVERRLCSIHAKGGAFQGSPIHLGSSIYATAGSSSRVLEQITLGIEVFAQLVNRTQELRPTMDV
ncbi:uncharacterized protein CLUP02_03544 [Colletotrichum lupini]|uniref:Uncharacterized protein n=1 Tax=Colletotrichum lupini TaxID=145971 RepID=A0A9Q8SJI2_9PEZI|nr:uncharacterized protein CLUP02_03544 [Colletotrichum lupini]UQC78070.1 hypothetical protein CLUP02_03544 [Colletotrichum lupini]